MPTGISMSAALVCVNPRHRRRRFPAKVLGRAVRGQTHWEAMPLTSVVPAAISRFGSAAKRRPLAES
jgi:hypothetical protein